MLNLAQIYKRFRFTSKKNAGNVSWIHKEVAIKTKTMMPAAAAPESPSKSILGEARGIVLSPLSPSTGPKFDTCEVSSPLDTNLLERKAMRSKKAPVIELFGPSYDVRTSTIHEDVPRGASPPVPAADVGTTDSEPPTAGSTRGAEPALSPGPLSWDVVGSLSLGSAGRMTIGSLDVSTGSADQAMSPSFDMVGALAMPSDNSARAAYNQVQFSPSMGQEAVVRDIRWSLCASPEPLQPFLSMSDAPDNSARAAYNSAAYSPSMGTESQVAGARATLAGEQRFLPHNPPSPGGLRPFGAEERASSTGRHFAERAEYNKAVFSPSMGVSEEERAGVSMLNSASPIVASRSPSRSPSHSPGDSLSDSTSPEAPAFHHALPVDLVREVSPSESHMSNCTTASDATSMAPGDAERFENPVANAKGKSLVARVFSSLFSAVMG